MKKIHVVGAAIIDVLVSPADERVFQTGSLPADRIVMHFGGDALNEATVLQKLGAPVQLETIVGNDAAGNAVCRRMETVGLCLDSVHVREGLDTSVNVVLVKPDGERCFLTSPRSSQRKLRLEDIILPLPADTGILSFASIFVFPDIKTAELEALFSQAKRQSILVCADITKRKGRETAEDLAPALRYVDYLFPNEAEAMLLTGADSAEAAADILLHCGVGTVVVKCGARGCYVKSADGAFWSPAAEGVSCVDTTGAGDSFTAGFLYGLANGYDLQRCAAFANRCGGKAVGQIGATAWIAP